MGAALEASRAECPDGPLAWQWLRDDEPITGAEAATYTPAAADVGATLSVRVARGDASATSEPTAPVWAAPASPALATGEEELLATTLTLGASDEFALSMGGYNRFAGTPFGEMDETSFDEGARSHVVEMVMVNEVGRFALATRDALPPAGGLAVYWNAHRIGGLEPMRAAPGRNMLAAPSGIPRETYLRIASGEADGVKVAVSVRRTHAVVGVTAAAITSGPGENGAWDEDETVEATLTFSAPVTVSGGPPTLAIVLDGDRREAAYGGGSGTERLSFAWTVTEADAGAKRARVASNGLALNGATLTAGANTVGDIGFDVAPWVTGVAIAHDASGDREWTAGETIEARLTFTEPVTVADGAPWLEVQIGGFPHPGTLPYAGGLIVEIADPDATPAERDQLLAAIAGKHRQVPSRYRGDEPVEMRTLATSAAREAVETALARWLGEQIGAHGAETAATPTARRAAVSRTPEKIGEDWRPLIAAIHAEHWT